jgi:hypothetical protein
MRSVILLSCLLAPALGGCMSAQWLAARAPRPVNAADAPEFRAPVPAGQLVIHADFALPPGHRMVSELTSERQLVADALGVPSGNEPIHVYLFAEERAYRTHVARKYPNFPERRAIFVETDVQLSVYAHWSDHVAEDLRHEVAHGYLHSSVPNLPLWLDEGLAEYFEVGRGRRGVNRTHVDYLRQQLAAGGWQPNLPRLEQLVAAETMTQFDYAEAWLWVHFLLEAQPDGRHMLAERLAALQRGEPAAPLSAMLSQRLPDAAAAVVAHLQSLPL